jgi:hypothetical protein
VTLAGCLTASGAGAATECSVEATSALKIPGITVATAEMKADGNGPPLCDVKGALTTTGEGAPNGSAGFEVRLPVQWNGKRDHRRGA